MHADPFVRMLELLTGTVVAALNLYAAYGPWKRRRVPRAMMALFVASVPGWCIYELVRHYVGERRVGLVGAGAEASRA